MSALLDRLLHAEDGAPLNVPAIREEIHDEFKLAKTPGERASLLAIFKAVMDAVERSGSLEPEELKAFQDARSKDYNLLIVSESLVGESVCTEILNEVTQREVSDGRMEPDHELRTLAVNAMAAPYVSKGQLIIDACIKHARTMLASQMLVVGQRSYDFMPEFEKGAIQLFLIGVMWRYSEQFDLPITPRERALIACLSMLIEDGMSSKKAQARLSHLTSISVTPQGDTVSAVAAGFSAELGDSSLADLLDSFKGNAAVSGGPYRLINRSKSIALILAVSGALLAWLFGRDFWEGLGVGLVFGGACLAIARMLYSQMLKDGRS